VNGGTRRGGGGSGRYVTVRTRGWGRGDGGGEKGGREREEGVGDAVKEGEDVT